MPKRQSSVALVVVALGVSLPAPCFGQATFMPWGNLPGNNNVESQPLGVSADGTTAVGYFIINQYGDALAVRWTLHEGLVSIGYLPGGTYSRALGVSATGEFIAGWGSSAESGHEAFRWSSQTGMVDLGGFPGNLGSDAYGISADGSVVVGSANLGQTGQAYRWTQQGGMSPIGVGVAFGVSGDGNVIVGSAQEVPGAFRWTPDGGMEQIGDLPGGDDFSIAWGVSGDGTVVVGGSWTDDGGRPFRWTEDGGMESLGDLPGDQGNNDGRARAASWDGSVIVGQSCSAIGGEAFIWTEADGIQSLRDVLIAKGTQGLDHWELYEATGISADGTVVVGYSYYKNPCGGIVGWVVDLKGELPVCYPDCDASCSGKANLNLFDFLCFQNKFEAHDPYADCTGDGLFDLFDFLCFVNEFNEGC